MATLGSLDKVWILFLQEAEVLLRFPIPWAVGSEEQVHFFQSALAGFGVQGPNHGDGDNIGGGENVVSLLVEGLEHDRAEESEPSVTDGPSDDTPGVTLGTDLEREDLGGVEPGDGKPGGAKGGGEKEDHSHGTGAVGFGRSGTERLVLTRAGKTASEEHGNTLDNGAPVESPATTDAIKSEHADECGKHVGDGVET